MQRRAFDNVFYWEGRAVIPPQGSFIKLKEDKTLDVPPNPIIPFIEGDGIGPEITQAMLLIINEAVKKAYDDERKIYWVELLAGDKAEEKTGERLPQETLEVLKESIVAIKGPLGTPVGKGVRSINSALRRAFDYYSAVRPVYWMGQPTPIPEPQRVDVVVFRENTDDVYAGVEFFAGTPEAKKVREFLIKEMGAKEEGFPEDVGITVKPMSEFKTKRHVRKALRYALETGR
ncbi:MAG: NADP-dependent isocitrate dehydrogenase, partial [Aquificae bacterium]|nr:NADP-dependent isocitrate dehydrogenase [Aquificota bacterium]